jgi:hypothetical protein
MIPEGDNGHWKVVDGVIDYDAMSEALLLYDILQYVERDATRMLVLTLTGLVLMSLLAFRRFWDMSLQFGVLLASLGVAIGWIGLVGVQFNFLNIVVIPIWLGLGIDATFHLLFNLRDDPKYLAGHMTTALAISAAFFTTMIGFGVTLLAHHDGLYSLGAIAVTNELQLDDLKAWVDSSSSSLDIEYQWILLGTFAVTILVEFVLTVNDLIMGNYIVATGAFAWFGHLPGDIRIERGNTQVFIPITSMVVVSIVLSVVVHIVRRFFG